MNALSDTSATLLAWVEVTPRHFELQAESDVIATLRWPKPFRSVALGEAPDGLFIFKRISRFGLRVRVRDAETGTDVAALGKTVVNNPDTVKLSTGEAFTLKPADSDGLAFHDPKGDIVVTLCDDNYSTQHTIRITRGLAWKRSPAALLLTMLGLYVLELQSEDDTAVGMAATGLLNVN